MTLDPADWMLLARAQWRRFLELSGLERHRQVSCFDRRLTIDCDNAAHAHELRCRIDELREIAWIVLGCDELAIYCGDLVLYEGATR